MIKINDHIIGHSHGSKGLLDFVKDHQYRNYARFDTEKQLEWAKKIARVDDDNSREAMLVLLEENTRQHDTIIEMHKEFDTVHTALSQIENKLNPPEPKKDE